MISLAEHSIYPSNRMQVSGLSVLSIQLSRSRQMTSHPKLGTARLFCIVCLSEIVGFYTWFYSCIGKSVGITRCYMRYANMLNWTALYFYSVLSFSFLVVSCFFSTSVVHLLQSLSICILYNTATPSCLCSVLVTIVSLPRCTFLPQTIRDIVPPTTHTSGESSRLCSTSVNPTLPNPTVYSQLYMNLKFVLIRTLCGQWCCDGDWQWPSYSAISLFAASCLLLLLWSQTSIFEAQLKERSVLRDSLFLNKTLSTHSTNEYFHVLLLYTLTPLHLRGKHSTFYFTAFIWQL